MPSKSAPGAISKPDAALEAAIAPIVARPPQQPASFAATELLRDSAGYQDWLLVVRSRLQAGVLRYLESGEPCASWPPSLVPLWDHYALSSLCSSVDPRLVLPGLSTFRDDSDGAPKIWQALRSRYGATSAVDLLPAVVTLFSTEELPATTDSFLQFRDSFENQLRLLTSSKVTVDSLVASHLLSRLPPSLESWRSTFVNDQGD
ncbi:BZ3500_MvSof-1268-A1-R1_Chr1-3g02026 [Microbotryum saponariae]|uniref:BZ3500_MvSof-1268-A1-R1_Chr1-3g02026 protein n=1 Tax=Microbotryum saponariae TaxID=289078 RepID=A0A2X0MRU4_9BASI|nr:BZ3500_MvSof-1268-A1-R1_Chr1-3g02026 [Microbotryum saponariae]SCZ95184.1 BZ3501_MvSof-1269-A2-R1_Chr1-3g01628 [Microbotryum saponariae]